MSVTVDISGLTRLLARTKKQFNTAVHGALNEIAEKVMKKEQSEMQSRIDRPTPFTMKGMIVRKSYGSNYRSIVQMKDIQAKYLEMIIKGGSSTSKKPLIDRSRMNKYGNVPKNFTRRSGYSSRNDFIFLKGKIVGIWSKRRTYRKQFDFFEIGEKEAKRIHKGIFRKHLIFRR